MCTVLIHRYSGNPDEWGPAVSTTEQEDGGLVEASCQRNGALGFG
jgi:hypothetical protein